MPNSKQKGKRGELLLASKLREYGYADVRRTAQFCGNTGEAADLVGLPGIHPEVKFVERLNVQDAMDQAVRDEKNGRLPVVFHKRSRCDWLVTMRLDDWIQLYSEWEAGNKQ